MNLNNPIEEFQYLETVTDKPPESFTEKVLKYPKATSFHNFAKNRYKNVLPNEETRVKLKPVEGICDSDYINANFVKSGGTTYICCQAPMPTTIADFWRMIWEQEACVIVMLTELVSTDGQAKAHVYWPVSRELSLVVGHNFKVTLLNETQEGSITVRFLEMSVSGDACVESRKITQIHYTGWPDFSLPSTATEFRNLLRSTDLYKDRNPKEDGSKRPLVVHCSAGVGRTGVFVAGRTCLKIVKQGKQASILQIVKSLRDQRTGMVSTLQQYQFLYTLVNSYVPAKRRSLPTLVCHPHIHENTTMFEPVSAPSLIV